MAMTTMVTGRMFNGETHGWKDKKNKENGDRLMFRGRLQYRDRTNGEQYFIDAVCWKDFGDTNGLVGFLEKFFSADSDNAPKETGGQTIEVVGYIRPTEKPMKVPVKGKVAGKPVEKLVDATNKTFEFVIESVDFPPSNERKAKTATDTDLDFDDIDEDEDEFVIDDESTEEEEVVEEPVKTASQIAKEKKAKELAIKKAKAKKEAEAKAKAKSKKEESESEDEVDEDDDQFFED